MNPNIRCGSMACRRWLGAALLVFLLQAFPVDAQPPNQAPKTGSELSKAELRRSIESAVSTETGSLQELKDRLNQLAMLQKAVFTEINAYKIQNSSHGNLLLLPTAMIKDLEKALGENRLALNVIGERIRDFNKKRDNIVALLQQTQEQIGLGRQQQNEIKSGLWTHSEKRILSDALNRMAALLAEKLRLLNALYEMQNETITGLEEIRLSTVQLSQQFDQQIKSRVKQALLSRKFLPLKAFSLQNILSEFETLVENSGQWFLSDFWAGEGLRVRESGTMPLITLAILLVVGALLIVRFRKFCLKWEADPAVAAYRWRHLCLTLIRRSAFLLGAAAVLFGYDLIQFPHFRLPAIRLILNLLLVWVISRWILVFLKRWAPGEKNRFMTAVLPRIRSLAVIMRLLAIVYIVSAWALGPESILLYAERLVIELGLIAWCFRFWKDFRQAWLKAAGGGEYAPGAFYSLVLLLSNLVAIGGLVIEFAGYPALTVYWYVSWAKTLAVVFWAGVFFQVIKEWHREYRESARTMAAEMPPAGPPLRLFFIQLAWLVWIMALLDGLVLAWSTNWEVFRAVYAFMSSTWAIGQINLSLVGVIYALVILFFTHTLTRLGRFFLAEKMLVDSDMEPGLKASITTITVYLLWGLGCIFALSVLGVSATSLAVVFGALSIGIGFGLQNIFNNFISGIILLFERPIQVGDSVEIGGIWGEVKKINVRATVVQTFDNASLIIPNSEFISSQVTNWSFKDPRLRRKIGVGVAYGSDVELVRKTLLEIADATPNVLKIPKPDVLFMEHGASTLDFVLRYWTFLDNYYSTSTAIRFELDRLFRERGIEIAFPQQDVHIRSVVKDTQRSIDTNDSEKKRKPD